MRIKTKLILLLTFLFFAFLTSIILYYSIDEAPYNDKHLQISKLNIPANENGYINLMAAMNWAVSLEDITIKQSPYIGKMNLDDRYLSYGAIYDLEGDEKTIIDEIFVENFLRVNEKSIRLLKEVLNKYKLYQNTNNYVWPKVDDMPQKFLLMSKLLLFNAKVHLNKNEPSEYFKHVALILKSSNIFGNCSDDSIDGIVLVVVKNIAINSLIGELISENLDPNEVHKQFPDLSLYQLHDKNYLRTLKGEYQTLKSMLDFIEKGTSKGSLLSLSRLSTNSFLKKNMTLRIYGEFVSLKIDSRKNPFSRNSRYRTKHAIASMLHKNKIGELLISSSSLMLEKRIENNFVGQARFAMLETLIAILRYKKKHLMLPENLTDLKPEFLKILPLDSFDKKPIKYSKKERKIWTIARDHLDKKETTAIEIP